MHISLENKHDIQELHRCNHLPKVQPSSRKDLLVQRCTSWTWALRASQLSKMTFKLEAHNPKHALVLPTLQTCLCFFVPGKREIEDYLSLDLNFLNRLAWQGPSACGHYKWKILRRNRIHRHGQENVAGPPRNMIVLSMYFGGFACNSDFINICRTSPVSISPISQTSQDSYGKWPRSSLRRR
jgi:hypothetical protein